MSLTYYLLRLVNAPAFGMIKKVSSVKHALVVLGENENKKWISLIVLSAAGQDKPGELVQVSLLRARLAEQLSRKTSLRANSEHFFSLVFAYEQGDWDQVFTMAQILKMA